MTDKSSPSTSIDFDLDLIWYYVAIHWLPPPKSNAVMSCLSSYSLGGLLLGTVGDVDNLQSCLFVSLFISGLSS